MRMKICIQYLNKKLLASYVVEGLILYCMFVIFVGIKFMQNLLGFLSIKDLYAWYLKYIICSTWFLDIRISICLFWRFTQWNISWGYKFQTVKLLENPQNMPLKNYHVYSIKGDWTQYSMHFYML